MSETLDNEKRQKVERSIIKTYRKELLSPFFRAIDTYQLIQDGDKIAVCISGGKDSMLMAKLFQEIQGYAKVTFECVFLVMNPGYSEVNLKLIKDNAKLLGVPIQIFDSNIFDMTDKIEKSPCYTCASMRRGALYSKAEELGCNKIALGHHYDDVIETILMAMLYGAQIQTMMPKLKSRNFKNMEVIRPMYLIREKDILKWVKYNDLHFIQCACHFTEANASFKDSQEMSSKRAEIKKLIQTLKKTNPLVEQNIFKSVENVCMDAIVSYKKDDERHNFLEDY